MRCARPCRCLAAGPRRDRCGGLCRVRGRLPPCGWVRPMLRWHAPRMQRWPRRGGGQVAQRGPRGRRPMAPAVAGRARPVARALGRVPGARPHGPCPCTSDARCNCGSSPMKTGCWPPAGCRWPALTTAGIDLLAVRLALAAIAADGAARCVNLAPASPAGCKLPAAAARAGAGRPAGGAIPAAGPERGGGHPALRVAGRGGPAVAAAGCAPGAGACRCRAGQVDQALQAGLDYVSSMPPWCAAWPATGARGLCARHGHHAAQPRSRSTAKVSPGHWTPGALGLRPGRPDRPPG